jgi:CBS domain-containing protein
MEVRVADVMTKSVLTTSPRTKATDAALVTALHDITALPVLDGGRVVGMFAEADLLRGTESTDQATLLVKDVMSPLRLVATPECDATELAEAMRRHGLRSVPVLDDGQLVGIITWRDLRQLPTDLGGHPGPNGGPWPTGQGRSAL